VCIEPDPSFFSLLKQARKRDKILNVGIADTAGAEQKATLYVFPDPYSGWNTFSQSEAVSRQAESEITISTTREINLMNINDVIAQHFPQTPNLVSIDVEGLDLQILRSIDFERHSPEVLCVETITFSTSNQEQKLDETIGFVESMGYFVYADTHINTIFCRKSSYKKLSP